MAILLGCLLIFLIPLLSGCGGGGSGPVPAVPPPPPPAPIEQPEPVKPVRVAFLGDSLTAGGVTSTGIEALPVRRITQQLAGRIEPEDMAVGGTPAQAAIDGVFPWPGPPFAQWIAQTGARLIVIRYGAIEALFNLPLDDFEHNVEAMVALARARGVGVVLVGRITIPPNDMAHAAFQARYAAADAVLRNISARLAVPYIDVSGVPVYAGEMYDQVHPGPAYQDRVSDVIAADLACLLQPSTLETPQ